VTYVLARAQIADILTKPLPNVQFCNLRDKLGALSKKDRTVIQHSNPVHHTIAKTALLYRILINMVVILYIFLLKEYYWAILTAYTCGIGLHIEGELEVWSDNISKVP